MAAVIACDPLRDERLDVVVTYGPLPTPCHIARNANGPKGHARVGRAWAHIAVYVARYGPVPHGWMVHHKCERPGCLNPRHLMAVTPKEHGAIHANLDLARTGGRCTHGHGPEHFKINCRGHRFCGACAAAMVEKLKEHSAAKRHTPEGRERARRNQRAHRARKSNKRGVQSWQQ